MTRKDFEELAAIVKECGKEWAPSLGEKTALSAQRELAYKLGVFCSSRNDSFNILRFYRACGVE